MGGRDSSKESLLAYTFLVPLVTVIVLFMIYPLVSTLMLSFKNEEGLYIGFQNYWILFNEGRFIQNVTVTILYVVVVVFVTMLTGLLAAQLITAKSKFINFVRPLYLIPWIIPNVASAIMFRSMLDAMGGPIPMLVNKLTGKEFYPLADYIWSIWFVILHDFWRSFPFAMLFLAAGLTTIHSSIYEAAKIDGAGRLKQLLYITIPMIRGHLFIVTLMVTNFTLQSAESIYSMTQGGPGYATETLGVRIFKTAFVYNQINLGATLGVLMLLITLVLMFVYSKVLKTREADIYE